MAFLLSTLLEEKVLYRTLKSSISTLESLKDSNNTNQAKGSMEPFGFIH